MVGLSEESLALHVGGELAAEDVAVFESGCEENEMQRFLLSEIVRKVDLGFDRKVNGYHESFLVDLRFVFHPKFLKKLI